MHAGILITLEGGEGAGKSTLAKKLSEFLMKEKNLFVVTSREPGGTELGKRIRSILLEKEMAFLTPRSEFLLFQADRAEHVETLILPALEQDMIVIVDRFTDSSLVYQALALGISSTDEYERVCDFATGGLVPNLTLYLDLDPEIGLARLSGPKDRIESHHLDFHKQVRAGFQELQKRHPHRIKQIDANCDPDSVFEEAKKWVLQVLA
ncbi:MAG: dTMP kinase [Chlamydiae bacterium RIFCSPHIGHO2_12_FULL_49_11]|nr:MAG: dTMP kinase [Chlamydiae bacterium RIFCSPHIGHO2_12_FULL_49_11]